MMLSWPWWAAYVTWTVVNLVNIAQTLEFASRSRHEMRVNHRLGVIIAILALPATIALVGYANVGSPWWVGPAVFDSFVVLMLVVDDWRPVEFRQPPRPDILVPYQLLFFGGVLIMGISMYPVNRAFWLVTVVTTTLLLVTMALAMRKGTA